MLNLELKQKLAELAQTASHITALTGAGVSAESGIPTFRGSEGYWTIGSKVYHPQEMATYAMFCQKPEEVWCWYLYRRGVCRQAKPNPGHLSLVELEEHFGHRFTLITQNVDGLHLRAGNSLERTYQIHGNVDYMRCAQNCSPDIYPIPEHVPGKAKDEPLTEADRQALRCPRCGSRTRPHVLWFDEYYDEVHYRFQSSLRVADQTDLLIVAGTSGVTNLPNQVAWKVAERRGVIIDVNVQENIFTELALANGGYFLQQPSGVGLPELVKVLT
jgi:NAD-dependent deacetylase